MQNHQYSYFMTVSERFFQFPENPLEKKKLLKKEVFCLQTKHQKKQKKKCVGGRRREGL